MSIMNRRRWLLLAGTVVGGGALLGIGCTRPPSAASRLGGREVFPAEGAEVTLNGWVKVTPEDEVIVALPRAEMGQGVHSALALLVAEEMEADWARVRVQAAPVAPIYANPALMDNLLPLQPDDDGALARWARGAAERLGYALGLQVTGGSSSLRDAWGPLRLAGASARTMLVEAAAQRWGVPPGDCKVEEGVVSHAASQRRARFGELAQAAAALTPRTDIALKAPAAWRLIGKPAPRLDLPAKVNGRAAFGIDARPEGLLHAALRQCPVFGGRLAAYEPAQARARRGVVEAFSIRSAPGDAASQKDPAQHDTVVVLADRWWRAQQAVQALELGWDAGEHAALDTAALRARLAVALDKDTGGTSFRAVGDADAVIGKAQAAAGAAGVGGATGSTATASTAASATAGTAATPTGAGSASLAGKAAATGPGEGAHLLSARYEVPFLAHTPMEPPNCTAQFKDGRLTLWVGTQVPSLAVWRAAQRAGIDEAQVTLHQLLLGGGFGRRLELDMIEQAVAIALRAGGRPVKLLWSREEDLQHDFYRPLAMAQLDAVLGEDGRPLAWRHRVAAPSIGLATMQRLMPLLAADSPDKNHIEGAFDLPYAIPHLAVRQLRVATPVPVGSWRSVGHSYNAFFTEGFIDELAHAARQDPYTYRRELLDGHPRLRAVLELAASQAGWGTPLPEGHARGIALHESFGSICAQVAEVSAQGGEIRVHRVVAALDCGTVVTPDAVKAQVESAIVYGLSAALLGEITLEQGRVEQANFPGYDALRLAQTPQIEVHLVPSSAPPGGVGEPGTPPIAPAVANALFALTGQRLRRLPLKLAARA